MTNSKMPSDEFWQDQYEAGTTGWDRGEVHPALSEWIEDGQLSPSKIVVPGCGRGHEVTFLAELRFDVTAIDYAAAPIQFLRSKLDESNLSAALYHGDMFAFNAPGHFDAVYEQTCLCAIEPQLRTSYEDQVFTWLKPSGKFFLLMMQVDADNGPPFHCDLNAMRDLFAEDRWNWQTDEMKKYEHPSGQHFELAAMLTRRG